MLSDPLSVSLNATITPSGGTAKSLPRIRTDGYASEYQSSDGLYSAKVTHTRGSRVRSEFRVDFYTTYADPTTGLTKNVSASAYVVVNRPQAGFTSTQLKDILFAACAYCGVTANADKLLALES
jgi:hypothetical protein